MIRVLLPLSVFALTKMAAASVKEADAKKKK